MDTKTICTLCGKALAANAPEGLCPECLLKAGRSCSKASIARK